MSVRALRTALAQAVVTLKDDIPGWKVVEKVPDRIDPWLAVVYRNTIRYDQYEGDEFGGDLDFAVMVYAPRTNEDKAQEVLDALVEPTGSTSMKVAIEQNAALCALCGWVLVPSAGPVMRTTVGDLNYLTVEWPVQIGA